MWQRCMIFLARRKGLKHFMQNQAAMSELSRRFVGGSDVAQAVNIANTLKSRGCAASLYYLGEYVEDAHVIAHTVSQLRSVAHYLAQAQLDIHISVDPTQIGHQLNSELCRSHAFDLANEIEAAAKVGPKPARHLLMLDMEDGSITQATVDLHRKLSAEVLPVAITLQAYLYRTESDLEPIIRHGGTVRLVKGAFAEGKNIAFTRAADIDNNFMRLADRMLSQEARGTGFYPIFGTHDDRLIEKIIHIASARSWPRDRYEFEMLYGVRRNVQEKLVRGGQRLRLYLPFGTDWWPYAVRRVGERFKNLKLLMKAFINA